MSVCPNCRCKVGIPIFVAQCIVCFKALCVDCCCEMHGSEYVYKLNPICTECADESTRMPVNQLSNTELQPDNIDRENLVLLALVANTVLQVPSYSKSFVKKISKKSLRKMLTRKQSPILAIRTNSNIQIPQSSKF